MNLRFFLGKSNRFTMPYLMHLAEKEGFSVSFFEDIPEQVDSKDIIVFSFLTTETPVVDRIIGNIRSRNPGCRIIAGGPHITGNPQHALKKLDIDLAVSGYAGPGWVGKILEALEHKQNLLDLGEPESIDDNLPVPAGFRFRPPLEIRYGCRGRCAFCLTGTRHKIVHRSRDSIVDYLDSIKHRNFKRMSFVTPSAFEDSRDDELAWLLEKTRTYDFEHLEYAIFPSEADPRTITRDRLSLVREFCSNKKITIGCQSGSRSLLASLRRSHNLDDIEAACSIIRESGFLPMIDFIVGYPGENPDHRWETVDFIIRLVRKYNPRIQFHYFLPLPGTELGKKKPTILDDKFISWLNNEEKNGYIVGAWKYQYATINEILPYLEIE